MDYCSYSSTAHCIIAMMAQNARPQPAPALEISVDIPPPSKNRLSVCRCPQDEENADECYCGIELKCAIRLLWLSYSVICFVVDW